MQITGHKIVKEPVRIVINNSALWDAVEQTVRKELLELDYNEKPYHELIYSLNLVREAFNKHCED